jgi:hypothetical protein
MSELRTYNSKELLQIRKACCATSSDTGIRINIDRLLDTIDALVAERNEAREKALRLIEASKNLLEACHQADAKEELPPEIDGSLIDAVRLALLDAPAGASVTPMPAESLIGEQDPLIGQITLLSQQLAEQQAAYRKLNSEWIQRCREFREKDALKAAVRLEQARGEALREVLNHLPMEANIRPGKTTDELKGWNDAIERARHNILVLDPSAVKAAAITEQDYVAWCRYAQGPGDSKRIVTCDSDEPGAFKVYRHGAVKAAEEHKR